MNSKVTWDNLHSGYSDFTTLFVTKCNIFKLLLYKI